MADATALLGLQRARTRRDARSAVLAAQRAAYGQLQDRVRAGVQTLLAEPARRAALADLARASLGDAASIHDHPDGGLRAETPDGRSVDASVGMLVDRALSGLDLERLWATD